jgi:hypothetical protein
MIAGININAYRRNSSHSQIPYSTNPMVGHSAPHGQLKENYKTSCLSRQDYIEYFLFVTSGKDPRNIFYAKWKNIKVKK